MNFDGETGPYVQYTHARACSVLKKAGYCDEMKKDIDYSVLTDDASADVCKILANYSAKIKEAANRYEPSVIARYLVDLSQAFNKFYHDNIILPSVIARYLVDLSQAFNKFYHDNIILTDDEAVRKARLMVVDCVRTVLKSGLAILGIKAPEQM